jgi:protein SCO1/2
MRRLALLLTLLLCACSTQPTLKGTDLGKEPAPDVQLVDQNGAPVTLSGLRGNVVVLTFLYTHCPDECPLIAGKLSQTSGILGQSMNKTKFVAVSVDPKNDTPISIAQFIQEHQLLGQLTYLVGPASALEPVWKSYGVYAASDASAGTNQIISHSTRVIVIDKSLRSTFERC